MPEIKVPSNWTGSKPEFVVYVALIRLGYKEGRDFTYQSAIAGGRMDYGGAILDFVIPGLAVAINVQSVHWHYADPTARRRDAMVMAMVVGMGLRLIYIDEVDALANPLYYVKEALAGRQHAMGGL